MVLWHYIYWVNGECCLHLFWTQLLVKIISREFLKHPTQKIERFGKWLPFLKIAWWHQKDIGECNLWKLFFVFCNRIVETCPYVLEVFRNNRVKYPFRFKEHYVFDTFNKNHQQMFESTLKLMTNCANCKYWP